MFEIDIDDSLVLPSKKVYPMSMLSRNSQSSLTAAKRKSLELFHFQTPN